MKLAALLSLLILLSVPPGARAEHESHGNGEEVLELSLYLNQISAAILYNEPRRFRGRMREILSQGWRYCPVLPSGHPSKIVRFTSVDGQCQLWFSYKAWHASKEPETRWLDTCEAIVEGLHLPDPKGRCKLYFERRVWPDTRPT